MTWGQVLDPITAPQNIFLSMYPTRYCTFCCILSPSPPRYRAFCAHPHPVTVLFVPIPTPLPQSHANKNTSFPGVEKTMDIF